MNKNKILSVGGVLLFAGVMLYGLTQWQDPTMLQSSLLQPDRFPGSYEPRISTSILSNGTPELTMEFSPLEASQLDETTGYDLTLARYALLKFGEMSQFIIGNYGVTEETGFERCTFPLASTSAYTTLSQKPGYTMPCVVKYTLSNLASTNQYLSLQNPASNSTYAMAASSGGGIYPLFSVETPNYEKYKSSIFPKLKDRVTLGTPDAAAPKGSLRMDLNLRDIEGFSGINEASIIFATGERLSLEEFNKKLVYRDTLTSSPGRCTIPTPTGGTSPSCSGNNSFELVQGTMNSSAGAFRIIKPRPENTYALQLVDNNGMRLPVTRVFTTDDIQDNSSTTTPTLTADNSKEDPAFRLNDNLSHSIARSYNIYFATGEKLSTEEMERRRLTRSLGKCPLDKVMDKEDPCYFPKSTEEGTWILSVPNMLANSTYAVGRESSGIETTIKNVLYSSATSFFKSFLAPKLIEKKPLNTTSLQYKFATSPQTFRYELILSDKKMGTEKGVWQKALTDGSAWSCIFENTGMQINTCKGIAPVESTVADDKFVTITFRADKEYSFLLSGLMQYGSGGTYSKHSVPFRDSFTQGDVLPKFENPNTNTKVESNKVNNNLNTNSTILENNQLSEETKLMLSKPMNFYDVVPNAWFFDYVVQVQQMGFMTGDDNGTSFRPGDPVNRAEAAKIIIKADGRSLSNDQSGTQYFCDVQQGQWFYDYVHTMYLQGWVDGYVGGNCSINREYRAGQHLTRAEAVKFLLTAFDISVPAVTDTDLQMFTDVKATDWYGRYVAYAYANALINGYDDGRFAPNDTINRAEMAKLLMLMVKHKNSK